MTIEFPKIYTTDMNAIECVEPEHEVGYLFSMVEARNSHDERVGKVLDFRCH